MTPRGTGSQNFKGRRNFECEAKRATINRQKTSRWSPPMWDGTSSKNNGTYYSLYWMILSLSTPGPDATSSFSPEEPTPQSSHTLHSSGRTCRPESLSFKKISKEANQPSFHFIATLDCSRCCCHIVSYLFLPISSVSLHCSSSSLPFHLGERSHLIAGEDERCRETGAEIWCHRRPPPAPVLRQLPRRLLHRQPVAPICWPPTPPTGGSFSRIEFLISFIVLFSLSRPSWLVMIH